jgi:DNA polymerase III subunit delta'
VKSADWGIIGHEWAVELLARDLAGGAQGRRLGHAYLFAGPPCIGKRTLALKFAQAINCVTPDRDLALGGCGECRPCTLIAKGRHPDAPIVQSGEASASASSRSRKSDSHSLRIEQVRDLERQVALAPYEARYRTPILLRFHEATTGAQNALLKTLEEPPPQVVLLLTADSPDRLLPTITSRCQVLYLRPLPPDTVEQALRERGVESEQAHLLARLSGGRVGWAVSAAEDSQLLERRAELLDEMLALLPAPRRTRAAFADAFAKRGRDEVTETLELWQTWWRDVLLAAGQAEAPAANVDRVEAIQQLASRVEPARLHTFLQAMRGTVAAIERNANMRLALEVLLFDLPVA